MPRALVSRISQFLHRPLFGTRVIPRDASVDPALFPEDEFPVYCSKCAYLLRGLRDGACPECGKNFRRGQLLVTQYVFGRGYSPWKRARAGRLCAWSLRIGVLLVIASLVGGVALVLYLRRTGPAQAAIALDNALRWSDIFFTVTVAASVLCAFSGTVYLLWFIRLMRPRRRRVIEAIPAGDTATNKQSGVTEESRP